MEKTLGNTDTNTTKSDVVFWGIRNMWKLLSKASSQKEGWMKSTKAMSLDTGDILIQVTTQQRNPDGSYAIAEAITFVKGPLEIQSIKDDDDNIQGRYITLH